MAGRVVASTAVRTVERVEGQVLTRAFDVEQPEEAGTSVSTRKSQTSVPTSAATWLCTTEPISTPISSQRTTRGASCRPARRRPRRRAGGRRRRSSPRPTRPRQPRRTPERRRRPRAAPAIAFPASTRSRPGVASSVGVIVPCLNSVVTIVIPRMIASSEAIPTRSTSASWKSNSARPRSGSRSRPRCRSRRSATITIRYAHQARVVRTLSSSERTSAVTRSSPRRSARGRPPRASRARP